MSLNDDLLKQGPREAPEPETFEERAKRMGMGTKAKTAGGVVAGGGAAVAKLGLIGGIGKFFLWLVAWHALFNAWRIGAWAGILAIIGVIAVVLVLRAQRRS